MFTREQLGGTGAGGQGGGPGGPLEQRVQGRLLVHHGSVGLGAGRQALAVGLAEDAVLVVLLDKRVHTLQLGSAKEPIGFDRRGYR